MIAAASILVLTVTVTSELAGPSHSVIPVRRPIEPAPMELVEDLTLVLPEGANATGLQAIPRDPEPRTLVVFCHALGASAEDYRGIMEELAQDGVASVAMEYRGERNEFKVAAGAEDTAAATRYMLDRFPTIERTIIYGFSMGGAVSGLTVASMPPGTFDVWISGAGVADVAELYEDVEYFRPLLENETGGSPEHAAQEYAARSPAKLVHDIAAANLSSVILVHARADPAVPFSQAQNLSSALAAAGTPVLLVAVGGSEPPWACSVLIVVCVENRWATMDSHFVGHMRYTRPLVEAVVFERWSPTPGLVDVGPADIPHIVSAR